MLAAHFRRTCCRCAPLIFFSSMYFSMSKVIYDATYVFWAFFRCLERQNAKCFPTGLLPTAQVRESQWTKRRLKVYFPTRKSQAKVLTCCYRYARQVRAWGLLLQNTSNKLVYDKNSSAAVYKFYDTYLSSLHMSFNPTGKQFRKDTTRCNCEMSQH